MSEQWEVIEAFVDGEPVDADALKTALSAETGREHLVDVLALRGVMGSPGGSRPVPVVTRSRSFSSTVWRAAAAAALVALSIGGGYFAGRQSIVPAPPATQSVTGGATADPNSPPPPTRVIRLEHGVDWSERSGGN